MNNSYSKLILLWRIGDNTRTKHFYPLEIRKINFEGVSECDTSRYTQNVTYYLPDIKLCKYFFFIIIIIIIIIMELY